MASTPTRLMTVAEYAQIPDPPGGRYELYHGELLKVSFPEFRHIRAQRQLRRLLENAAGDAGIVDKEIPFRPLPEHECWGADVAFVSKSRWEAIDRYLMGPPELVAEIRSPSNTMKKLLDKRSICLKNGAKQFWLINTELRQIEVSTPDGRSVTYNSGEQIPLFFAPGSYLDVAAVFV